MRREISSSSGPSGSGSRSSARPSSVSFTRSPRRVPAPGAPRRPAPGPRFACAATAPLARARPQLAPRLSRWRRQDEDLDDVVGIEQDLALVAKHPPPRDPLGHLDESRPHLLLEAQAHMADEGLVVGLEQRPLDCGEAALHYAEDELAVLEGAGFLGPSSVELGLEPHHP